MRNHPWSITLLILFALTSFGLFMRPSQPLAAELQATKHCIFLPLIPGTAQNSAAGTAQKPDCVKPQIPTVTASATATRTTQVVNTPTRTTQTVATATRTTQAVNTPTNTVTTPEPDISLAGALQLRPEHQLIPQTQLPQRYTVVLDVSGSMSANFNGQCNNQGQSVQCTNGPPGASTPIGGAGENRWWDAESERRIYVAKQAIIRLISLLNMPGNPAYTNSRPADQLTLVVFNDGSTSTMRYPSAWDSPEMSNAAALQTLVLNANSAGAAGTYRTTGGTNGAAGLYRAYLALQEAPASVTHTDGKTFDYAEHVVFITDGVSNNFLDTTAANLWGGGSSSGTYPSGHACQNLGNLVAEDAECQTTTVGGAYNGWDRPITQLVKVSTENVQQIPNRPQQVFAIALSHFSTLGLQDGVATTSNNYFSAPSLIKYADGSSNVDRIMDLIATENANGACRNVVSPTWVDTMANANLPTGVGNTLGEVVITGPAGTFTAPVTRNAITGKLNYSFTDIPAGEYELEAELFYKGEDSQTRTYNRLSNQEHSYTESHISVTIPAGANGAITQPLYLRVNGNVCAPIQ